MELNEIEISRVAETQKPSTELHDLQLALVGGGIGETVL